MKVDLVIHNDNDKGNKGKINGLHSRKHKGVHWIESALDSPVLLLSNEKGPFSFSAK
jgi:hypothetical protein